MFQKDDLYSHERTEKDSISEVHICTYTAADKKIPFKVRVYSKEAMVKSGLADRVYDELCARMNLNSRNVVNMLDVFQDKEYIFSVYEYHGWRTLQELLDDDTVLAYEGMQKIVAQIFSAVFCFMNAGIGLQVLIPDMVFVDESMNLKVDISDTVCHDIFKKSRVHARYVAPELLQNKAARKFSVLYSLGKILLSLNDKVPIIFTYSSTSALIMALSDRDPEKRMALLRRYIRSDITCLALLGSNLGGSSVGVAGSRSFSPIGDGESLGELFPCNKNGELSDLCGFCRNFEKIRRIQKVVGRGANSDHYIAEYV